MLADVQYRLLNRICSAGSTVLPGAVYHNRSKLAVLLGQGIFERLKGKTVVDFGCGYGEQTIELAERGAKDVIGIDIREDLLKVGKAKTSRLPNVTFVTPDQCPRALADFVISLDSFEHFANPAAVLAMMYDLLAPGGSLLASFGPPWLHPLGGHDFSVFPWAHVLLSERALCRWYSETRSQKVHRFEDVSGGLNRMTIAKFERLVREAPFSDISVIPVPIRKLRRFHNRLTREFTTSIVRCELKK